MSHLRPMGLNVLDYHFHQLLRRCHPACQGHTKDLLISPRFLPTIFLSLCKFSSITRCRLMVAFMASSLCRGYPLIMYCTLLERRV